MSEPTCPACGESVEDHRQVGPVTVALLPCEHQVDERLAAQLLGTLHVRIGSSPDRSDLETRIDAIEAGEDVEPRDPTLTIADLETFGRVFRPTNLELLDAVVQHQPESIRALARVLGRDPPEVLDDVNELADYGLLELREDGRAKRPVVPYDEIDVQVPLGRNSRDVAGM